LTEASSRGNQDHGRGTVIVPLLLSAALAILIVAASNVSTPEAGVAYASAPSPAPVSDGIYGPGIGMTSLSNTPIGGPAATNPVSFRFRVERSGDLATARIYVVTDNNSTGRTGYSGGNGGSYRVSIRPDDGSAQHLPSSQELAAVTITPGTSSAPGYVVKFSSPPRLSAGKLYHMVIKNIDSSPQTNWLSVNSVYLRYPETPLQPRWENTDWAQLYQSSGSWRLRDKHAPILDLGFADGHHEGNGYIEISYSSDTIGRISGSRMVRERFTPRQDRVVTGLGVRLQRVNGSDPLVVRLLDASGTVLGRAEIKADAIPVGPASGFGYESRWVDASFASPVSLQAGRTYRLEFSTKSTTEYATWVIREGTYYGYHAATVFTEGLSEKTSDGSSWSRLGRVSGANDMQFYLATSRPHSGADAAPSGTPSAATAEDASGTGIPGEVAIETAQAMCADATGPTAGGIRAPTIFDVDVIREGPRATVQWRVDPPATGQVAYGRANRQGYAHTTTFEPRLLDYHSQKVPSTGKPSLLADRQYKIRVCAFTPDGYTISDGHVSP
jgi:hypothetical protein